MVLLRGLQCEEYVADRGYRGNNVFELERADEAAGEFHRAAGGFRSELCIFRSDLARDEVDGLLNVRWARQQRGIVSLKCRQTSPGVRNHVEAVVETERRACVGGPRYQE